MFHDRLLTIIWFVQSAEKWEQEGDKSKVGNSSHNVLLLCRTFVQMCSFFFGSLCRVRNCRTSRYVHSDWASVESVDACRGSVLLTLERIPSQTSTNVANPTARRFWVRKAVQYFCVFSLSSCFLACQVSVSYRWPSGYNDTPQGKMTWLKCFQRRMSLKDNQSRDTTARTYVPRNGEQISAVLSSSPGAAPTAWTHAIRFWRNWWNARWARET